MEILAVIVMAFAGWGHARLGLRELKGVVIVALGWTTVVAVALLPSFGVVGMIAGFVTRFVLVGAAYAAGVGARHLSRRYLGKS